MEAVGTGAAANVASEAAKGIFQEIKRVFIYKKNVGEFDEKLKALMAKRDSVKKEVDAAKRNVEEIKPDVQHWCDEVDKAINEEEKKVRGLEDKAKNKCFFDLCPNIKSRYQLSKEAEKAALIVDKLTQQCQFNQVGYRPVPKPPEGARSKNFKDFDSRNEIFARVIEALKDSTISMIGVYGTGGVGKTTLVNEVAGRVQEDKLFSWVAKATVTRTPNIERIQYEIAEPLGLKLNEKKSEGERARLLSERLKQEERVLVVLDDIWASLDLKQVGIPLGDQHKGCKILLTSRNRDVLTNEMDAKKDAKKAFPIEVLEEKDAWNLFKETVENDFKDSELRSVATEVAKKCEGLPVAIVTVARALRSKELFAWEDALARLQRPSPNDLQSGIPAAVFSAIELSYKKLESEELRQTFLLCGLLGHNARVEDLLRYTMGLSSNVNTVKDTRNRVLTLVNKLKAFCLLRDSYSDDRFDMHDFDCDVALAIASRDKHAFALKHKGVFNDWPDEEQLRMISLSFDSVEKFPHQLECPRLDFFCMGSKDSDVEMPASFFQKMENLKVLDLIKIKVSSISLPASLRTLCLNECVLRDMVNLGKLKNLEILNLSGSRIKMLPEEAGQLTKLRLLDVSYCCVRKIPAGVLSSLSKLEELYMDWSFYGWNEGSNARLDELRDLPCLTTLNARIPDAKIVPYDLFSLFAEKLKRYRIFIGRDVFWDPSTIEIEKFWRALILSVNTRIHQLDDRVQCLLMKSTAFYLGGLKGAKIVFSEVGNREGLLHLKHIHIEGGPEIQYIMQGLKIEFQQLQRLTLAELPQLISFCSKDRSGVSTSTSQHDRTLFSEEMKFPCLEKLELHSLNVEKIWPNQFSIISDYPQNLTSLTIKDCHNLKHIVSYSVAISLTHLKSFEINGCNCLKEIIFMEDIEEDMSCLIFPKLELLKLQDLPNLTRFCHGSNFEFPLLKEIIMGNCLTFKTFISKSTVTNEIHIIQETEEDNLEINVPHIFNKKMEFLCLEKLELYSFNVERICPNEISIISDYLQNLTSLSIHDCDNLKHILSFSVARSLRHLKSFKIKRCKCLREIIFAEDIEEDMKCLIFPKLELLKLQDLPNLTRFCHGSNLELPLLKELIMRDCLTFKTFISKATVTNEIHIIQETEENNSEINVPHIFNEKIDFPCLEKLELYSLNVERICPNEILIISDYLQNLTSLSIQNCDNLKHILSYSVARSLRHLKSFKIKRCKCLREIIFAEDIEEDMKCLIFPKLELLKLQDLPNLTRFCHGSNLELPLLKELIMRDCLTFKTFISKATVTNEIHIIQETEENNSEINVPHIFNEKIDFPCLEKLELYSLNVERICPNEILIISDYLQNLTSLSIQNCDNLKHILSYSVARSLRHLKSFKIKKCKCLREIIFSADIEEDMRCLIFPKLELLKLRDLPNLTRFWRGSYLEFTFLKELKIDNCLAFETFISDSTMANKIHICREAEENNLEINVPSLFNEKVAFRCLEKLTLLRVGNCRKIWHDQLASDLFCNLNNLYVSQCNRLLTIFPVSMSGGLQNLKDFKIEDCDSLEEIFEHEVLNANKYHAMAASQSIVEEKTTNFVFPRLKYLEFNRLPRLRSFYSRIHTSNWPSLERMKVCGCDKVEIFVSENLLSFGESTNQQPLFWVNEVSFPNLEELTLKNNGIMKEIWHGQFRAESNEVKGRIVFTRLKYLNLKHLPTLAGFCLGDQIFEFPALENMIVRDCPKMKIFCQGDLSAPQLQKVKPYKGEDNGWQATWWEDKGWWEGNLKNTIKWMFEEKVGYHHLRLFDTSELMEIWSKNPQEILASKYLTILEVYDCSTLRWLFTLSIALSLQQVRHIKVKNCTEMEHIIIDEGADEEVSNTIVFPLLRFITLESCANLASFYRGSKMLEFPSLERVLVVGCPQMFAFASSFSREQRIKTIDDGGNTTRLSKRIDDTVFFDNMVAFPCLKFLLIEGMGELRKIWDDKVTINSSSNLFSVVVKDCERLSNIFPFNMMERLQKLYRLEIVNCDSLEEIIGPQGLNSNESHAVTGTEFRLSELPELTHLSKEELPLGEVVFNNFRVLKVSGCGKLKSLVTLPVAKSMVFLKEMSITNCQMLEEIIASTSDEVMDGIIFSELQSLELDGLSSLSRFCSGNYMLEFPSLEKVIMRQCPKMEIFSKGELSTPKLRRIEGDYVGRWEGNLNATIQQLFKEKSVQNSEEETKVSF